MHDSTLNMRSSILNIMHVSQKQKNASSPGRSVTPSLSLHPPPRQMNGDEDVHPLAAPLEHREGLVDGAVRATAALQEPIQRRRRFLALRSKRLH